MRLRRVSIALVLAAGCTQAFEIPDGSQIACPDDECPEGWTCRSNIGRCVKLGADPDAPTLVGEATLTKDVLSRGEVASISFDVSEPLFAPPQVTLTAGGVVRSLVLNPAHSSGQHYTFDYTATGDEPQAVDVSISSALVDLAGNEGGGPTGRALRFDFTPPVLTGTATPEPAVRGEAITFQVTSNEPLALAPLISAAFVVGTPVCVGATPGTVFTCPGAQVSPTAGRGTQSFGISAVDVLLNPASGQGQALVVGDPVVSLERLIPSAARLGQQVTLLFSGDQKLTGCTATVGGLVAACEAPSGPSCPCTFTVSAVLPEGEVPVVVTGIAATGTGHARGVFYVDNSEPLLAASLLTIVRNPLGAEDGVRAAAGAATEQGPVYDERRVTKLHVWDAETHGNLVVTATPGPDGSFDEVPLPGTAAAAPARLWASAVDFVGHETARVEILGGSDVVGPTIDGHKLTIVRRDLSAADGLSGSAAAVADLLSAPADVRVWDASAGGHLLGQLAPAADGSFPELTVGTATSSYSRLFVSAVDKCGNEGPRAEALVGRDTTAPQVDGGKLTFFARPAGTADGLSGAAGGVVAGAGAVLREVRIFESPGATAPLYGPFLPQADGSFAEVAVGDGSLDRAWLEAVDKAGNVARVASRQVQATLDLSGEGAQVSLFALPPEFDPRTSGPLAGSGAEASTADAVGASAIDAARASLSAAPGAISGAPHWRARTWPTGRSALALAYDSARRRVVLFGGAAGASAHDETWEWDGASWTGPLQPASRPSGRTGHSLAFDSTRGKVVLFGGHDGATFLDDLWEWDGTSWTGPLRPASRPAARGSLALAFDSARGRTVLFGGKDGSGDKDDAWEWDGTSWTGPLVPASRPSARSGLALAYDSTRARTVLFGGNAGGTHRNDVWEWDGTSWQGPFQPSSRPGVRHGHALAFDSARARVVLFGGNDGKDDVWEWDGTSWRGPLLPGVRPSGRSLHGLAYDSARKQVVAFGGYYGEYKNDVWAWDGAVWTPSAWPSSRAGHALAYDSARGKVVLFGGVSGTLHNDLWEWDGSRWASRATSAPVPFRESHAMAYDSRRSRVVVFGGEGYAGKLGDLWEWDGTSWSGPFQPALRPGARSGAAFAFDSARGKVVLFGGADDAGRLDDLWEWDGTSWSGPFQPASRPAARLGHALAFDAARGKTVLFGGTVRDAGSGGVFPLDDVWEWDGAAWAGPLSPASRPSARSRHAMAYDSARQKVVLFGGGVGNNGMDDVWEWDGTSWDGPHQPATRPPARHSHAAAFDEGSGRMVAFGGTLLSSAIPATWEWAGPSTTAPAVSHAAHSIAFRLDPGATLTSISASYVGAGQGDPGSGVATPGVELLIWRWPTSDWESLGSHSALDSDPAAARTLAVDLQAPLDVYFGAGWLWLRATPLHPSSSLPGAVSARLFTDYVRLQVDYVLAE